MALNSHKISLFGTSRWKGGALVIIKYLQEAETWKTIGMVIGSPALTSAQQGEKVVDEEIIARQQLTDLFKKIAEFGRKKRLGKAE